VFEGAAGAARRRRESATPGFVCWVRIPFMGQFIHQAGAAAAIDNLARGIEITQLPRGGTEEKQAAATATTRANLRLVFGEALFHGIQPLIEVREFLLERRRQMVIEPFVILCHVRRFLFPARHVHRQQFSHVRGAEV